MIKVEHLTKKYGEVLALDDLSFEIEEGQVWEAAMAAAHYGLDHMIAFVDHNGLQIDGRTADVMNVDPVDEKFAAFGWCR